MLDQAGRAGLDRADLTGIGPGQPVAELGIEVRRRGERPPGHERCLEVAVAPLDEAFGLRVVRAQLHDLRRQRAGECAHPGSETAAAADAGLVVPDQPAWHPAELLDQLPGPEQQVFGLAGRQHPPGDEPRVRRDDDQHREQRRRAVFQRDPPGREPQVALPGITGGPDQPVGRIGPPVVRPQRADIVAEPGDRPGPAGPLGDHRRRHLRMLGQDRPHPRLERRERRRGGLALVLRRPVRLQRTIDRRPPDPQLPRDLPPRNPVRDKPPDQRPVLHRDHPSNLSGWPRFQPSLWPRFQASPTPRPGIAFDMPDERRCRNRRYLGGPHGCFGLGWAEVRFLPGDTVPAR